MSKKSLIVIYFSILIFISPGRYAHVQRFFYKDMPYGNLEHIPLIKTWSTPKYLVSPPPPPPPPNLVDIDGLAQDCSLALSPRYIIECVPHKRCKSL